MIEIAIIGIIIALIFDFVNGFNDSANSVATVIGTRVLRPIHAVTISAIANFAGPFICLLTFHLTVRILRAEPAPMIVPVIA